MVALVILLWLAANLLFVLIAVAVLSPAGRAVLFLALLFGGLGTAAYLLP